MNLDPTWAIPVLSAVFAAGGAIVALNGTRKKVNEMHEQQGNMRERLAKLEAWIKILLGDKHVD